MIKVGATAKSFGRDLHAVRAGQLGFTELIQRHEPLLRLMVQRWAAQCPRFTPLDDFLQDARVEVWDALRLYEAERGVPIEKYVRTRVRQRMLATRRGLKIRVRTEAQYFAQQLVEERVVRSVLNRSDDSPEVEFVYISQATHDETSDLKRRVFTLIGDLPPKQARLIASLVAGQDSSEATARVYGARCKRPRKAALRAFAAASDLVESSTAQPPQEIERPHATSAEAANDQEVPRKLKPVVNVRRRRSDPGQGQQGSATR